MSSFSVLFKNTYANCLALPACYTSVIDCCQSVRNLNVIKCQLNSFLWFTHLASLLLPAVPLNTRYASRYFLWRIRCGEGWIFLTIPKSQHNCSCLPSCLEKLEDWHWFISNHNSDIIAISEASRINEESTEVSQHSLAIIQLEETVQMPENSLNTYSAFECDSQVLQGEQDLLVLFPCACCWFSYCQSWINCTPGQI